MADTTCVADPLSDTKSAVLRAYVDGDGERLATIDCAADAADRLVVRGLLQRHERGVLVTPEGVAASLGG
jgi:hypothetical protein